MLNTGSRYRLVFCTDTTISLSTLVKGLNDIAFIGNAILNADATQGSYVREYCVGDAFLHSITFMGCSPAIEFEPPTAIKHEDPVDFCFIRILATLQSKVLYHTGQLETLKAMPRCKKCRKVIQDWNLKTQSLNVTDNWQITCPSCATSLSKNDLDWRKASGTGNLFIEVLNVYLQEALPTDVFLQQLESVSASKWQYFYTDTDIKTKLLDR
ncbi:hypothetical protein JYT31_01175 [Beggiatoa alba]|nr:hypothetical protein [Beggiatoa alba]